MAEREKRGLGRGLSALMADVDLNDRDGAAAASKPADQRLPIERVSPNPDQPRRDFDETALKELSASIAEKGIIQPLIVRADPSDPGQYQIVAGERRWRAAQMVPLHEVPVVIREFTDGEVLEIAIIENVQRADLNPVEEALGYRQLQEVYGHTQEQLSQALGKSRSHIANLMRLLNLPSEVLAWLREDKLSAGHARALITADDPVALAKIVINKGLSVRETEKLAKSGGVPSKVPAAGTTAPEKDADTRALEADLQAALGMRVTIDHASNGEAGKLSVNYKSFEELDELCRKLSVTQTG
ncbi:MAG: ParB/RepB/Spo0J family partition protein [Litoreibacter sp.]|nr:ParB/RepB/Spo0J family partition protein [Litoreibacter sp.]